MTDDSKKVENVGKKPFLKILKIKNLVTFFKKYLKVFCARSLATQYDFISRVTFVIKTSDG